MQATLTTPNADNARNYGGEKETIDTFIVIGVGKSRSDIEELATLRIYGGRSRNASRIYASFWLTHGNYNGGTGWAGGGGYHKASAAAAAAIRSAGIKLDQDIGGRGDSAIREALEAIGIMQGFDTVRVIRA